MVLVYKPDEAKHLTCKIDDKNPPESKHIESKIYAKLENKREYKVCNVYPIIRSHITRFLFSLVLNALREASY